MKKIYYTVFLLSFVYHGSLFANGEGFDKHTNTLSLRYQTLENIYNLRNSHNPFLLPGGDMLCIEDSNSTQASYFTYIPPYLSDTIISIQKDINNIFTFTYKEEGGPNLRYNEITQEYELDYENFYPGFNYFHLNIKRIENNEEFLLPRPIPSAPSALLLSPLTSSDDLAAPLNKEKIDTSDTQQFSLIQEPYPTQSLAHLPFQSAYIKEQNLWIGIERLTDKNVPWWRGRLGWDAHMHFNDRLERDEAMRMLEMQQKSLESTDSDFEEFVFGLHRPYTPEEFKVMPQDFVSMKEEVTPPSFDESYDTFMKLYPFYYVDDSERDQDYLGAWRGFIYNLKKYQEVPTYVAYFSSTPLTQPMSLTSGVTSPHLKMAMTLTLSQHFYSPLGIYKSPIAIIHEQRNTTPTRNLSMLLHSYTASLVNKIVPSIDYMLVKPLTSMATIFEKSSIPFSTSAGPKSQLPHISWKYPVYNLVDKKKNTIYQMDDSHWFSTSPFLGGGNGLKFPIYTIQLSDLTKHLS